MHETAPTPAPANAVILVLDRSGSMAAIRDNTVRSLNEYLDELRDRPAPGLTFTLITFDSISTDMPHRRVPIAEAPTLTNADLVPRGSTPLIDAVAIAISTAKHDFAERDRIILVVMTDGLENASREFSLAQLRDLIKERTAAGWDFVFLGAGIDAYADSGRFGLDTAVALAYDARDPQSSRAAYRSVARRANDYFATGEATSFSDEEKREAGDRFMPKRL